MFIRCLFNDAVSSWNYTAWNDSMSLTNWKGRRNVLFMKYRVIFFPEELNKITKFSIRIFGPLGQDFDPGPPEYEKSTKHWG